MKKKILALVATGALVCALGIAGCSSSESSSDGDSTRVTAGPLTMVTEATYPPFESVSETTGEPEGFDIDMAQAVADKLGLTLVVKQMDFDLLLPAVDAATECDIAVAGISVTDERLEAVDFTDLYYSDELAIAVMSDSGTTSANLDDVLATGTIAVQSGTTGETQMREDYPNATIVSLAKTNDCFAGLLTGEYDAVCTNAAVVNQMISATYSDAEVVKTIATGEEYAIAVNKNNTELTAAINEALAELTEDGTLADLLAKWGL